MNERMLRSGWRRNVGHVKAERCFDCHRGNNVLEWAAGFIFPRGAGVSLLARKQE